MTKELQAAINALRQYVESLRSFLWLADDMVAFDGTVTAFEVRHLIHKMDIQIDLQAFANGSWRDEANYNNGNPNVSFTPQALIDYSNRVGGIAYLIAHTVGHMTQLGQALNNVGWTDNSERFENDFARALSILHRQPVMAGPGYGYSSTPEFFVRSEASLTFEDPNSYSATRLASVGPDGIPRYVTEYS